MNRICLLLILGLIVSTSCDKNAPNDNSDCRLKSIIWTSTENHFEYDELGRVSNTVLLPNGDQGHHYSDDNRYLSVHRGLEITDEVIYEFYFNENSQLDSCTKWWPNREFFLKRYFYYEDQNLVAVSDYLTNDIIPSDSNVFEWDIKHENIIRLMHYSTYYTGKLTLSGDYDITYDNWNNPLKNYLLPNFGSEGSLTYLASYNSNNIMMFGDSKYSATVNKSGLTNTTTNPNGGIKRFIYDNCK